MRIFVSTGEPSGDLHAANLVHSLRARRPDVEVLGFGGPKLASTGATILYPLVDLAVMWFVRVLLNLPKFFKILAMAERSFIENRPDAVVLIDYPGFHWHVARVAKKHGIPVFYFVPPQIWAWGGWRVKKMRERVDHVLCSLPFEEPWYHERGVMGARYIGHPYFDELLERKLDFRFLGELTARPGPLVAILPGSRTQELTRNLPIQLRAAAKLASTRPDVRFAVACLHARHRELALQILEASGLALDLEIHAGKTAELIRAAELAWAVSGSVSLELMTEAKPTVIVYKVKAFDLWVARKFIKSKFITLVNLLADAELMPEYLTPVDVSTELAGWAERWLADPAARQEVSKALARLREKVAAPGASDRAADCVISVIEGNPTAHPALRGPHEPIKNRDDAHLPR